MKTIHGVLLPKRLLLLCKDRLYKLPLLDFLNFSRASIKKTVKEGCAVFENNTWRVTTKAVVTFM